MSIYSRDNINYQSAIDNMLRNKQYYTERAADRRYKQADIKAQAAKNIASGLGRALDFVEAYHEDDQLDKLLKEAEARRDAIRRQYTYNQDYKPYSSTDEYKATQNMTGYWPDLELKNSQIGNKYKIGSTWLTDDAKTKWLNAHPGKTEADYDAVVEYMNSIYGG